jgi:CDP-diacylglycerol--glycerol-3-phosphate 3-phosphatidyltransferase
MNLPNKLTLSRIGMTFLMMSLLFMHGVVPVVCALIIFICACITDFLDGWIARKRQETSDFGKILDPVADKILVLGAFLSFVQLQLIPAWMVVIVIIREFSITGMRLFAMRKGIVLAAENAGKHKTVSQMVTIFLILIFLVLRESAISSSFWNQQLQDSFKACIIIFMAVAVVLTLCSGFSYLWQNRKLIKSL